jgi:hypothetical protein
LLQGWKGYSSLVLCSLLLMRIWPEVIVRFLGHLYLRSTDTDKRHPRIPDRGMHKSICLSDTFESHCLFLMSNVRYRTIYTGIADIESLRATPNAQLSHNQRTCDIYFTGQMTYFQTHQPPRLN